MYSNHCHDGRSNASRGFPDSSIKLEDMVKRAKEIGLQGIAITNHETVGSFVEAKNLEKKYDFPVICGNEVYLVSDAQYEALKTNYQDGMYFPHFILLAKDKIGAFQLIELSTIAWVDNSFTSKGLIRTPIKMSDIERVIGDNRGHLIATSACLGGSIPKLLLSAKDNPERHDLVNNGISCFIEWCKNIFGEDNFYLECQPAVETQTDQLYINDQIKMLSQAHKVPYTIATDAHYLKKELLGIHEKFLNSKESDDREVESFYRTAYLMNEEEVYEYFKPYWTEEEIKVGLDNTIKIGVSCERYNFDRKQVVPEVDFEKKWENKLDINFFPHDQEYIQKALHSEYYQDRYLMYQIQKGILKLIPESEYQATFNRIEEELLEIWHISLALNDRIGNYFITMSKMIEIIWDRNGGDSLVGVGRGSGVASIIDYLLEITQVNPIKMPVEMPFYRFMAKERVNGLPDLDIDTQSNRRLQIFNAIKRYFNDLGGDVVNCCTYGVYGSKSALKTAGRGLGLSSDDCNAMASLIPSIRGFTLSLDECYFGNEEKGLQPITQFVNMVNKYEGLFDTAKTIEGVFTSRGVHASGVFITNEPFTNFSAKMKSPKGIITSQWDLHESEQVGLLKYDFLTISALDKIRLTIEHLIANNYLERQATLKETYLKYFNTNNLDYDHSSAWEKIHNNEVTDLFQFDSMVAMDAVNKIKPTSLIELMQTNSLMRLQQQEGATESPVETYKRFKNNMSEWDREMDDWKIPVHERVFIKDVLEVFKGVADTQESMMSLVRHADITGFNVSEAHQIRGAVAKKKAKEMAICKDLFYEKGKDKVSQATLDYLWNVQIMRQASYAFSILHTLAYTFIALIELVLYTKYPSIYWNCSCLTVNAEAIDEDEFDVDDDEEDIWQSNSTIEEEDDEVSDEDDTEVKVKSKSTDYGKVASAIAKMQTRGVHVSLPPINTANLSFYPDEKNDRIVFGMKGIVGLNDEMVRDIVNNRPYSSLMDFHKKLTLQTRQIANAKGKVQNKALIPSGKVFTLIKAGAFDELENRDRTEIMKDYINLIYPPKKKMTMANIDSVVNLGIVPEYLNTQIRYYRFKNFVSKCEVAKNDEKTKSKKWFKIKGATDSLTAISIDFFNQNFVSELTEDVDYYYDEEGSICVLSGADSCGFNRLVESKIVELKEWLNSSDCIDRYNDFAFNEKWETLANGTISKWEMDSVGFYYNEHELSLVDNESYGIVNYFDLPSEPEIIGYNTWKDVNYPKYPINRVCGTVVGRDKTKHMITLLSPKGAFTVKFDAGSFSHYDKQISYLGGDGKKITLENGWFRRGTKLLICGYRNGDRFKPKKYRDTPWQHTVSLIEDVLPQGKLQLKLERSRI